MRTIGILVICAACDDLPFDGSGGSSMIDASVDATIPLDAVRCSLLPIVAPPWDNGATETVFDVPLDVMGYQLEATLVVRASALLVVRHADVVRMDLNGTVVSTVALSPDPDAPLFVFSPVPGAGDEIGALVSFGFGDLRLCLFDGTGPIDPGRCAAVSAANGGVLKYDQGGYHVFSAGDEGGILRETFDATPAVVSSTAFPPDEQATSQVVDVATSMGTQHVMTLDLAPGDDCVRLRRHTISPTGAHEIDDPLPLDTSFGHETDPGDLIAGDGAGGVSLVLRPGCSVDDCDPAPERAAILSTFVSDELVLVGQPIPQGRPTTREVLRDGERTVTLDEGTYCEFEPPGQTSCYRCVTYLELSRYGADGSLERGPISISDENEGGQVVHAAAVIAPGDYVVVYSNHESAHNVKRLRVP